MSHFLSVRRIVGIVIAFACAAATPGERLAQGQTLLRWKLTPGSTLQYEFHQATRTETTGTGKPTTILLDMTMRMTWTIDQAPTEGKATMTQSIDRLTMSMQVDDVAPIVYDSAARPPTSGPAKEIADSVGSLIGGKCQVTMSDRGEIISVEPGEQLQKGWEKTKAGSLFGAEGLTRILRQASIILPEKTIEAGAKWDAAQQIPSPLGELQLAHHYVYEGPAEREGLTQQKITVTTDIEKKPQADAAAPATTLKEGSQSGTLWFDSEKGRFVLSQLEQQLVSERPYRDTTIRVRSTSNLEMRLIDQ